MIGLKIYRMMSDYKVDMMNDGMNEFYVHFHGPNDSKSFIYFFFFFVFVSLFEAWAFNMFPFWVCL